MSFNASLLIEEPQTRTRFMSGGKSIIDDEAISQAAEYLKRNVHYRPLVCILSGPEFCTLEDVLLRPRIIRYDDIPGFPNCEVIGNEGSFVFGQIAGKPVVAIQRGVKTREIREKNVLSAPLRVLKMLGVEYIITTTSACFVNPKFEVGDMVIVKDHVDMTSSGSNSPFTKLDDAAFGSLESLHTGVCDCRLRDLAIMAASELRMKKELRQGTYFHIQGLAFDTPNAHRTLINMGCDIVGTTLSQGLAMAKHLKFRIFAMALVTARPPRPPVDGEPVEHPVENECDLIVNKRRSLIIGSLLERMIDNL